MVLCTDLAAVLAVRQHVEIPVTLVQAAAAEDEDQKLSRSFRVDEAHDGNQLVSFQLTRCRLAVAAAYRDDQALVSERLAAFSHAWT